VTQFRTIEGRRKQQRGGVVMDAAVA